MCSAKPQSASESLHVVRRHLRPFQLVCRLRFRGVQVFAFDRFVGLPKLHRSLKGRACLGGLLATDAACCMVIDQPHCLHEGKGRGWADKFPTAFFQGLGQGDRIGTGALALRFRQGFGVRLKAPEKRRQRACLSHQLLRSLRVVDHGFDFATVANDTGILQQARHIGLVELGDLGPVEATKGGAKILAFGQNGAPAQARLKTLETDFFKQTDIIVNGIAPFPVVVGVKFWRRGTPGAAQLPI